VLQRGNQELMVVSSRGRYLKESLFVEGRTPSSIAGTRDPDPTANCTGAWVIAIELSFPCSADKNGALDPCDALRRSAAVVDSSSVIVIAQKIVSKSEGRQVFLDEITPSPSAMSLAAFTRKDPALVEMILQESTEVVRAQANVLIVRDRLGYVVANAGIDQSNVDGGR
jgi:hypothetical protein